MKHSEHNRTRVLTLVGTIITQFALGSVYTWSLFNAPLADMLDAPISKIAFTFGLLSLALAVASAVSGKLQDAFGVKKVTYAAGLLLALGFYLTSHVSSVLMLYIFAGIIVGFADGTGYLMTLSNCVKWFPERKGLISACSIGAYGLASLAFKFINMSLLANLGLTHTFEIWGLITMCLIIIGGSMMTDAPKQQTNAVSSEQTASNDFSLAQATKTPQYWMLFLMFITACMSGLYVIGVAKDVGESYAHLSVLSAANAVAVISVANLLGRLVLGVMSDKVKRIMVISLAQIVTLTGISILLFSPLSQTTFYIAVGCIAFSFGGTITVFPSLVSDFFGLNNLTKNYGLIYLGFGIGSIIGSVVASGFGGFQATFWLILGLSIISLAMSITVKLPKVTATQPAMLAV